MHPRSIRALQADALFTSALRRTDEMNISQIQQAIAVSLDTYGALGCAGRVAQEFGDYPETAPARMRWARAAVSALDGNPSPACSHSSGARPFPPEVTASQAR